MSGFCETDKIGEIEKIHELADGSEPALLLLKRILKVSLVVAVIAWPSMGGKSPRDHRHGLGQGGRDRRAQGVVRLAGGGDGHPYHDHCRQGESGKDDEWDAEKMVLPGHGR